MDDAKRYSAEFDQLMCDAEAQAKRSENRDREAIWKRLEKSFGQLARAHNWSPEKCAAGKKYLLDHFWD